jgi:adenosylmethionine-8-amino-7-oxononanoate aminotransferase
MLTNSLAELDRQHLLHPVSSFRGHEARGVRVLRSASGATVTDAEGRQLIDGFAGLWCVNAGYGHESVVEAAAKQMRELAYATGYFDLGAEAPIRLAAALADRAPGDLDHVYFTLGGSDAVDSSIRFIRYYWHAKGQPERDQFISVASGYHGSTTMGAGLTALPLFHDGFGLPHASQHKISSHYLYRNPVGDDPAAVIAASVAELQAKIAGIGAERVAAFYVEPIQGSGGVLVPPPGWIKAMRAVCAEHGILFVADEVITAFGRTGPLFACEDEGIVPDLMTIAKGLTSGYVPMGAVLMSDHVYQTIADGAGAKVVGHGFTYSAHPVSAAVGLEVLALYEGGLLENGRRMGARLQEGLRGLSDHPLVGDVRGRGMLAAVELVTDKAAKTPLPAALQPATRLFDRAWEQGLVLRSFAQGVFGYAPPLCCTEGEIDAIVERTRKVLDLTLEDPEIREVLR